MSRLLLCALACLLLTSCVANHSPQPVLPAGAHWISSTLTPSACWLDAMPGNSGSSVLPASILAATSLASLRLQVQSQVHLLRPFNPTGDPCTLVDSPAKLYVAAFWPLSCAPDHRAFALKSTTLYFVDSLPNEPTMNCSLVGLFYQLYLVPRSQLPASGTLTVQNLVQNPVNNSSSVTGSASVNLSDS